MSFVTTSIRLPEEVLKKLKIKAACERKSVARLIREAAATIVGGKSRQMSTSQFKRDSFWKIVGMYDDGIEDGSRRHDRGLYGGD
ncbi:MAG: ribbon-helix-helix protein, CopG family [Bacteroidetes bacterium]|nr:ribbon-helix-helix protein, CopG family [Candidatus Omnitrophota bacterium]MBU1128728.1 ribbon-helix-helix protein, CopG family [Candidatus Omnitrophota bacterium]MBU1800609.1 ribbon-helix-helix protein, CopG family [Bacteroidota bacterium]